MIHAYLFVLNIREGNGGHGANFHKMMNSINKTAGTNITVYHTFHDEVNNYKTHVWRCNGICQHRKPFFGFIRRTCNRAPGPNDQWWAQHKQSCGGFFKKVSEPEPKIKRGRKEKPIIQSVQKIDNPKWGLSKTGGERPATTISLPNRSYTTPIKNVTMSTSKNRKVGGNLSNVIGFKDLNGE